MKAGQQTTLDADLNQLNFTRASPQRTRIVDAMVHVAAEHGFQGTSVGLIVARAKVSRRTFYAEFSGLDDCFAAALDLALELPRDVLTKAFSQESRWQDGVRSALAALLAFFDSEPQLTRIWFVEALAAGSWALEHRERSIAMLKSTVLEYWFPPDSRDLDMVLTRGVMDAVLGALHTHVLTRQPEPMISVLAPLTSLAMSPFLRPEAVKAEVERSEQLAQDILSGRATPPRAPEVHLQIPEALLRPGAYRFRDCLQYIAAHPGASNHKIGKGLGITHQSQTSKLLARLAAIGLLSRRSGAPGRAHAWTLTAEGERVARALDGGQQPLST